MQRTLQQHAWFAAGALLAAAAALFSGTGALMAHAQSSDTGSSTLSSIAAVPTDTGATVTWTSDTPSDSQVAYGTTTPYSTFSIVEPTLTTSHSVTLSGLMPSTLYHFEVISTDASGTPMQSSDQTFTTQSSSTTTTGGGTATSTATTTSSITDASVVPADTTAVVTWTTASSSDSQIALGLSVPYTSFFSFPTMTTNHSITLTNLAPGTLYHYKVASTDAVGNVASTDDLTFTTTQTSTTTGGTTGGTGMTTSTTTTTTDTDDQALQDQITQLQSELTALQNQITSLESQVQSLTTPGTPNTGGTSTTTTGTQGQAYIDQNGQHKRAGDQIDFGGHNFGHEEQVVVSLNGQQVATAHADGGGNFSTGSLTLPSQPGATEVYTFTGQTYGDSATATITLY